MSKLKIHFLTILIGFSQIYAWATTYYLPATLVKIVANELGKGSLLVIVGFSWALLIGGLCAPRIGYWIDIKGGQKPLFIGNLAMGFGLIVLSFTQSLLVWYLGWTIIGLGMALGLFNAVFSTVGRLLGQQSKHVIVRITLISGFATLFWPVLTYLIKMYGWHMTVFICALPHIFIWAPLYFFSIPKTVPEEKEDHLTPNRVVPEKIKLAFYILAVYSTLRAMVGTTISVDILRLFEGLGMTVAASALIASLIGPSMIGGRLVEMFIGRKFNPMHSSIFWTVVLPAAIALLVIVGPAAGSIFAIAYGMSNGVLTITMSILPMILFGSKGYASLLGKLALPVLISQALAPLLVAPLIEKWSSNEIFILGGVMGFIALLCLLMLAFISATNAQLATSPE